MKVVFHIKRSLDVPGESYIQSIEYETSQDNETVASALNGINSGEYFDSEGIPVEHIEWECSCMQKRCGACAMRINGRPRLACDAFLSEFSEGEITLEPLRKFPCIKDLKVDRSIMQDNLKEMSLYRNGHSVQNENEEDMYDASRCLQCGLCLEVCPNYAFGEEFFGAAGFVPYYRKISEEIREDDKKLYSDYKKHIYSDCAKALSCQNVCPAKIETSRLLLNSNMAAIWKKKK